MTPSKTDKNVINYYENLIEKNLNDAISFKNPVDATEYTPETWKINGTFPIFITKLIHSYFLDFGEYDFIVVGLGTSGAILLNRLSERPNWRILGIEAGDYENDFTDIPEFNTINQRSKYNWGFTTTSQNNSCQGMMENKCPVPMGKGIGGNSIISGLKYSRGNKLDYKRWEEEGNPGWGYLDVLSYFKKAENSNIEGDYGFHGTNGPLPVQYAKPVSPIYKAFVEANLELGLKFVDYNGANQIGVSKIQYHIDNGRRVSTGKAYAIPASKRKNVSILTRSYATKILINDKTAYGVEFVKDGKVFIAKATKEVLVSCGTFMSPHLLMLSGIGPKQELVKQRIPIIQDLKVGENYQDHSVLSLTFNTNYSWPLKSTRELIKEYLRGEGDYTTPGKLHGTTMYATGLYPNKDYPDLQILTLVPKVMPQIAQKITRLKIENLIAAGKNVNTKTSFSLFLIYLRPKSKGKVTLKSNNPFDYPLIDSNAFSDTSGHDLKAMVKSIKIALRLKETEAFKKINVTLARVDLPSCSSFEYASDNYWRCYLKEMSFNIFNPVGTCKMGNNSSIAVVDFKCKVLGIEGLRVVDSSIIPFSLTARPYAPSVMIAEKIADVIKFDWYLKNVEKFLFFVRNT